MARDPAKVTDVVFDRCGDEAGRQVGRYPGMPSPDLTLFADSKKWRRNPPNVMISPEAVLPPTSDGGGTMRRLLGAAALIAIVSVGAMATAQLPPHAAQDTQIDGWIGTWHGSGTLSGATVNERYVWEWVLGHQFARVVNTGTISLPDGNEMAFENQVFIKPMGDGTYTGFMIDDWGTLSTLVGRMESGELVVESEAPSGNRRLSTQRTDADTVTLHFARQDESGGWIEIGQVQLQRE